MTPRTWAVGIGWPLFGISLSTSLLLLILDWFPNLQSAHVWGIYLSTFIPLLWIPAALLALATLLLLPKWLKLIPVGIALVALLVWTAQFTRSDVVYDMPLPTLRVLSLNLQHGKAEITELLEHIDSNVDALALQEYTPEFSEKIEAAGIRDEFPYAVGTARTDAGGTQLLSRVPVQIVAETSDTAFDSFIARFEIDEKEWHLGVIHSAAPQLGADVWLSDGRAIAELAEGYADRNLVLVGDFNAINRHATMRMLTQGSLRNAFDSLGSVSSSWQPTWPVGWQVPRFARIDHALVGKGVIVWRPQFFEISGSDHLGLIVSATTS